MNENPRCCLACIVRSVGTEGVWWPACGFGVGLKVVCKGGPWFLQWLPPFRSLAYVANQMEAGDVWT